MKHAVRSAGTLLLMGTLMMGTGFAACAEEVVEKIRMTMPVIPGMELPEELT